MAYVTDLDSTVAVGAAIVSVIARLLYSVFYIANIPWRACLFGIGTISSGTPIVLSLCKPIVPAQ